MFEVKTMNNIAAKGLDELAACALTLNVDAEDPDGLLIRSAKLHDTVFGKKLLAIARAGVGTDNVPVERCTQEGIAVFNTAGANAEAVKELALCALLLASRDVVGGIEWVRSLNGTENIAAAVEKGKSAFVGPEINGKTLGIIGLGAIGSLIANAAAELGMTVYGYDPYMSVDAAWRLNSVVKHAADLETIFKLSDYIIIQVHYTDATRHMLGEAELAQMRDGVRLINLARGELVDDEALVAALEKGKIARYVTDFPNNRLAGVAGAVAMPHLGASTPESEEKCAVMAARELADYLYNGNVKNGVNLPNVSLERAGCCRLCVIHRNVPRMINRFLDLIGEQNINVEHMINKPKGAIAYTIIDAGSPIGQDIVKKIDAMKQVMRVRVIE
ncbi:MAG: 3-phosphoglycerate dehydrogenase family protein [Butyricicoccus sp.]|nr:3-phosphoglycerate dehydrogenase family protein [Butyricicoccus sp.]